MSFLIVLIAVEPVQAQETSDQLENVGWLRLVELLIQFMADILESSAELLRTSADKFSEMFASN